jgi:hypothetical protein
LIFPTARAIHCDQKFLNRPANASESAHATDEIEEALLLGLRATAASAFDLYGNKFPVKNAD